MLPFSEVLSTSVADGPSGDDMQDEPDRTIPVPPSRSGRTRRTGAVALTLIATVSVLALALSYAWVSYVRTTECPSYHYGDPSYFGMTVTRKSANWSVEVTSSQRGLYADTMFVQIVDPGGATLLGRTAWSSLTASLWSTYHVVYEDNHPEVPLVCEGDRLIVGRGSFPSGSGLWAVRGDSTIGWTTLW